MHAQQAKHCTAQRSTLSAQVTPHPERDAGHGFVILCVRPRAAVGATARPALGRRTQQRGRWVVDRRLVPQRRQR